MVAPFYDEVAIFFLVSKGIFMKKWEFIKILFLKYASRIE